VAFGNGKLGTIVGIDNLVVFSSKQYLVVNINTGDVVLRGKQYKNVYKDKDFELHLRKKDVLLIHEKGKCSEEGSGSEPGSKEEGHGDKQAGGTVVEPYLKQNLNSNPETGSRSTVQTGTSTNSGTGP